MIRCIAIGTTTVQGRLIRKLPGGMAQVRVGGVIYTGKLVPKSD